MGDPELAEDPASTPLFSFLFVIVAVGPLRRHRLELCEGGLRLVGDRLSLSALVVWVSVIFLHHHRCCAESAGLFGRSAWKRVVFLRPGVVAEVRYLAGSQLRHATLQSVVFQPDDAVEP